MLPVVARVASGVIFILRRFSDVLSESEPKRRMPFIKPFADFPKAFALVICQSIHWVEDQRAHTRTQFACLKFLIKVNQNGVEKSLGFPAPCSCGDNYVASVKHSLDCFFLVLVEQRCVVLHYLQESFIRLEN